MCHQNLKFLPRKLELESELFFALSQLGKENPQSLIVCFVGHMANCQYFDRCVKMGDRLFTKLRVELSLS